MNQKQTTDQSEPPNARTRLLDAAFAIIHRKGYQGLRIETLLTETGLTKGAFYHYFPSKRALGHAVIDEKIKHIIEDTWVTTLKDYPDPIEGIQKALETSADLYQDKIRYGCPLNNLAQEMSPIDESFRTRINNIFEVWAGAICDALRRGQEENMISKDIDIFASSGYIIASIEGCIGIAKNRQDLNLFHLCRFQLNIYLETLRLKQ